MKRRAGRKRKPGKRQRDGRLISAPRISPAQIAASMPHRRGCGERAIEQGAESELGRLVISCGLEPILATAGQEYARVWKAYMATLAGPKRLGSFAGRVIDCGGCLGMVETNYCICAVRKRDYFAAYNALYGSGKVPQAVVIGVVIHDVALPIHLLHPLRMGLWALAHHFRLTKTAKPPYSKNAASNSLPLNPK